ncbi:MAG TPA: hypothetical protein PKA05_12235 [Roseiflexaceae bacterium]|nr:hypothetical protein [Roseiflexaceae bacterium]HMP41144.1 hypothetical protein [Roseiflexaceae bacterium]
MNADIADMPESRVRGAWRVPALLALFAALTIGLIAPHVAAAQQVVTADPLQLTVAGEVGQRTERVVILTASAPVSGVSTLLTQFVRADNAAALTQSAVTIGEAATTIDGGNRIALPISFDLSGAASGEYLGSLIVSYNSDGVPTSTAIPVMVSIKDGPWGALFVLVLGVAIASLISIYRAELQPRDELAMRSDRLRSQVARSSQGMYSAFQQAFGRQFDLVSLALQSSRLDQARQLLDETETLLATWVQARGEWVRLGEFAAEIVNNLVARGVVEGSTFDRSIRQQVADALSASVPARDPATLQAQLNQSAALVNTYLRAKARVDDLGDVLKQTEAEQKHAKRDEEFARQALVLREQLAGATAEETTLTDIESRAEALAEELKALPPVPRAGMLSGEGGVGATVTRVFQQRAPELFTQLALSVSKITPPTTGSGSAAAWRIWAFRMARFVIAIAFLAGAGFAELYIGKATFGANWWSDYFTLLLWGFSSEMSRAAITDLTRNLGIPGQQQSPQ